VGALACGPTSPLSEAAIYQREAKVLEGHLMPGHVHIRRP
jgi:hypothetical protein